MDAFNDLSATIIGMKINDIEYFVDDGEVLPLDMLEYVESLHDFDPSLLRREPSDFSLREWAKPTIYKTALISITKIHLLCCLLGICTMSFLPHPE